MYNAAALSYCPQYIPRNQLPFLTKNQKDWLRLKLKVSDSDRFSRSHCLYRPSRAIYQNSESGFELGWSENPIFHSFSLIGRLFIKFHALERLGLAQAALLSLRISRCLLLTLSHWPPLPLFARLLAVVRRALCAFSQTCFLKFLTKKIFLKVFDYFFSAQYA